ncbi:hypothetical protein EVAR_14284_1 [Eumeta japonica]|uniref:Uncharacterized protein n=1 Tax=Eumeta variegata TaxID=151549 RepID=A0A4C1ULW7_EUMVA|nr:hypothetical protein EVAR_14284_1 [Eumeta japonica]
MGLTCPPRHLAGPVHESTACFGFVTHLGSRSESELEPEKGFSARSRSGRSPIENVQERFKYDIGSKSKSGAGLGSESRT